MRYAMLITAVLLATACSKQRSRDPGDGEPTVTARQAADMLHAVIEADRAVYTRHVVNRLTRDQKLAIVATDGQPAPLAASEQWRSEPGTLPLPAQMLRMGAEQVMERQIGLSYVLVSPWAINKQNAPRTPVETEGVRAVVDGAGNAAFYGVETLGDVAYFTAVYADRAIAPACVDCHNAHPESPRTDFAVGDVMGGVVIRIPLRS